MPKLTEAQQRANDKWNAENRARLNYLQKRSAVKGFILDRKQQNEKQPDYWDDLREYYELLKEKLKNQKK